MFTGIVQGIGEVVAVTDKKNLRTLSVCLPLLAADHVLTGASIANNGCCLTVVRIDDGGIVTFDVMQETLDKTNLGKLQPGHGVNIERAARFGDEIGGHLMSGHIATTVAITRIETDENKRTLFFRLPESLRPYIFTKGFVGLDGCSLTVGELAANEFCIHLIPETLQRTLFGSRSVGDLVNLEIDAQTQAIVDTVLRIKSVI